MALDQVSTRRRGVANATAIYASAWRDAEQANTFDDETFERYFNRPEPAEERELVEWEFFHDLWRRRVPPQSVPKELRKAGRQARRGLARAVVSTFKSRVPAWLAVPSHLGLLEFDPQVDRLIECALGPRANVALVERCRREAPTDDDGDPDVMCWVHPTGTEGEIEAMVGDEILTSASVPVTVWSRLRSLSERRTVAHGSAYLYGDAADWSFDFWYVE